MAVPPPESHAPWTAGPPWDQTSFLTDDADRDPPDTALRAMVEALAAADHAADCRIRREALERLSVHLAQQALRRGRTPIPKREF